MEVAHIARRRMCRILQHMAGSNDDNIGKSFTPEGNSCTQISEELLVSRSSQTSSESSNINSWQIPCQHWISPSITSASMFDSSNTALSEKRQPDSEKAEGAFTSCCIKWLPKMDVAESGYYYAVTVELPGVSIIDIKVVVDNHNLIVSGERSTEQWPLANCSAGKPSLTYHRREILHGPYHVIWPLPSNTDKDNVSAEFVNGFLRIIVPKTLRKVDE